MRTRMQNRHGLTRAWIGAIGVLVAGLLPGGAAQAQACGCQCPAWSAQRDFGASAAWLPTNASVLVDMNGFVVESIALSRGEGPAIPITVEPVAGTWVRLTPHAMLEPDTVYQLSARTDGSVGAPRTITVRLNTKAGPDHEPPNAGAWSMVTDTSRSSLCYDLIGGAVTTEEGRYWDDPLVVDVEVFDGATSLGRVLLASDFHFGTPASDAGDVGCFEGRRIDGLIEGRTYTARIRVWDAAGNQATVERTFVAATIAAIPPGTPCPYCAVLSPGLASSPGLPAVAIVIGLAALLSRRARWRRSRSATRTAP